MGCTDIILDPIGGSIAGGLGVHTPMDFTGAFFEGSFTGDFSSMGSFIKSDWTALKHLLVPDMRRDREAMITSAITARRWIYGSTRVSGQLSFAESSGGNKENFHYIIVLSGCQVSSFGAVTLDDRPIADFGVKASYRLFDGTQTAACDEMVAASAGLWTSAHKLLGCAYIYVKLIYDEALFPTGVATVKVEVNGKPVYDPRTGLTAFNANPAICARDYMLTDESLGGMGCTIDEINDSAIITAANICDEPTYTNNAGTTTEPRYRCNGVFNIDGTPKKILDALLQSMVGTPLFIQGQWHLYAGSCGDTSNLVTIDETWLNGGITFKVGASKSDKINTVKGTYVDPDDHWASKGFPPVSSDVYIDADGGEELAQDLTLNFTTSATCAQRIAKIIMEQSRRGLEIDYPCNFKAFKLAPYQLVRVNNTLLGWDQKLFRVSSWDFSGLGGVKLALREEDPAIYDWTPGDVIEVNPVPLTNLPSPWTVAAPTGITCDEELYATNVPGVIKSRAIISWSGSAPQIQHYKIEKWGPLDTGWQSAGIMPDVMYIDWDTVPGVNQYRITAVNALGAEGVATAIFTLLGKTAPPSDATGLSALLTRGQMRIFWDANTDLDIAGYELQLGTVWDASGNTILARNFAGTSYAWTPTSSGNINLMLKAIDTTGHYSNNALALTYQITAPGAVTNLTQNVVDNIVELHWTTGTVGSFPVDYYELWKGATFATATLIGRKYGTFDLLSEPVAGTYKYWLRAVDVAGLPSLETGVYAVVSQPPDYVLISTQNLDFASCTLTNAQLDNSDLLLPFNTTITWENHFQANPDTTLEPWAAPQNQLDSGYPLYAQPGPATALVEKVIDYGAVIPQSQIKIGVTRLALSGTVTFTPEILVSSDGSSYTSLGNLYETAATSFRYVKVRLNAATSDGGLASIQQINVKLDVKQKTYITGSINVTDTTGDGTQANFADLGIAPVDVIGISAAAPWTNNGSNDPITALINFVDAPNPTSFKVLAWNRSGTRVAVNGVVVTIRYI